MLNERPILGPSVAATIMLSVGFWAPGAGAEPSSLAEVKARGKLVVLCVPHMESHFVSTNLEAGPMRREGGTAEHFVGRDVDTMTLIAKRLGVSLEIRPAIGDQELPSYAALIPYLLSGKGDMIMSSFSITPERSKRIDYTDPYVRNRPVVVVRKEVTASSFQGLEGMTAAAIPGSSQEEYLTSLGVEVYHPVQYSLQSYNAVADGDVDFILVDSGSASLVLPRYDDLKVAFALPESDDYGIGVAPGSDLRQALNNILDELRRSGDLARIYGDQYPLSPKR